MEIKIKFDCTDIDWKIVSDTLKEVGMSYYEPHIHKKAFENSHTCVFIYIGDKLIAFGRAISDDAYQAAIYDVAVTPEFQAKGIGSIIIKQIISRLPLKWSNG